MSIIPNELHGQCSNCATEPSCNIKNKDGIVNLYEKLELECTVPVHVENVVDVENVAAMISISDSNSEKPYFVYGIIPDVTGYFEIGYTLCDKSKVSEKHFVSVDYLGSVGTFPFNFVSQDEQLYPKDIECGLSINKNIPDWIRNNAGWWSKNQIDDATFLQGIQYLIKEEIIKIPAIEQRFDGDATKIPDWIRNNAGWWADKMISNKDFCEGIEYLVRHQIIVLK